jgi:hypothetical protein
MLYYTGKLDNFASIDEMEFFLSCLNLINE